MTGHCIAKARSIKSAIKKKIREAIKKNLGDIVSEESIILSDGKKVVKVPIRSLDEYRFRYDPGRQEHAGEGNGKSKVGDVIAQEPRPGRGKKGDAGKEAGYDYYEAEITMEELAELIFEDLGLPNLEEKRQQELQTDSVRFTDVRKKGPLTNLDKKTHYYGEHEAKRIQRRSKVQRYQVR